MATRTPSKFGRKSSIIRDKSGNARQTLITRGPTSIRQHRRAPEKATWTKSAGHLVGKGDCVMIDDYTNEGIFLQNLKDRYDADIIYSFIRGVCISVNPYQDLGIYTGGLIDEYYGAQLFELPPHLYAVANQAYYAMKEENTDQCVLISGESGAGKTEAAKQILQFLASTSTNSGRSKDIRDRLLQSNPILEAFGNAKTLRNDNSSRFGKYMEVQFDFKGEPTGGKIVNYLLEKSRVVRQMDGERNFHIFYMLLATDEKVSRGLSESADAYHYSNQGKISVVETLNDVEEMDNMIGAIEGLGFEPAEKTAMLDLVAFVLKLGEVTFTAGDQAAVANTAVVDEIAKLIGTPSDVMAAALTNKTVVARGDTVTSPLNQDQAAYARDALGKAVYYRAFDWVVGRLNKALDEGGKSDGRSTVMGLLDIYGFEILAINGFEQICINYCNEKLQQLFIELTLKSEQEEYRKEGIEWVPIEYFNNEILCQLIESTKKPIGLLTILDDCCTAPGDVKDENFLEAMDEQYATNEYYSSFSADKKLKRDQFVVKHYAGDVVYTIDGFMDTNNDMLFRDLKIAMIKATNVVISSQFSEEELESKKRPPTAGHQFRKNMHDLMDVLMAKQPSYVRCIKPNGEKKANCWDVDAVKHQVKYLGLMENLRVARAGYCYRRPFSTFLDRYKSLCPDTWPNFAGSDEDGVKVLAASLAKASGSANPSPWIKPSHNLGLADGQIAIGKTKIFIKDPKSVAAIESAFQTHKNYLATKVAAAWRGYAAQKRFTALKAAALSVQRFARVVLARKNAQARKKAVARLRHFIKGFITRNDAPNECNASFIVLSKKLWLLKLADRFLPTSVLDSSWVSDKMTPATCLAASKMLKSLAHTNNCRKYRLALTVERKRQLTLKLACEVLFKGQKATYRATVGLPFVTNRIEDQGHFQGAKEAFMKVKGPTENIVYSTLLHKFDRSSLKHKRDDIVIVTETHVRVFGDAPKFKEKFALPGKDLVGLQISNKSDGCLVVSTPGATADEKLKGDKGDFIFDTPHVIELATMIMVQFYVKEGPHTPMGECSHGVTDAIREKLTIGEKLTPTLKGGKPGLIVFRVGPDEYAIDKVDGQKALVIIAPEVTSTAAFAGRVRASLRMRAE